METTGSVGVEKKGVGGRNVGGVSIGCCAAAAGCLVGCGARRTTNGAAAAVEWLEAAGVRLTPLSACRWLAQHAAIVKPCRSISSGRCDSTCKYKKVPGTGQREMGR